MLEWGMAERLEGGLGRTATSKSACVARPLTGLLGVVRGAVLRIGLGLALVFTALSATAAQPGDAAADLAAVQNLAETTAREFAADTYAPMDKAPPDHDIVTGSIPGIAAITDTPPLQLAGFIAVAGGMIALVGFLFTEAMRGQLQMLTGDRSIPSSRPRHRRLRRPVRPLSEG